MEQEPAQFDYLAWWTNIPGIPAGWPEPVARRSAVVALRPPEPAHAPVASAEPDRAAA